MTKPPATRRDQVALLVDQLLRGWREDESFHIKETSSWRTGLLRLIAVQLEPVQFSTDDSSGGGKKVSGSPSPWADDLAGIWIDVHAGARMLEADLHEAVHGDRRPVLIRRALVVGFVRVLHLGFVPVLRLVEHADGTTPPGDLWIAAGTRRTSRGQSDENTAAALQNIVQLLGDLERADPEHKLCKRTEDKVAAWVRRARQALGHDRRFQPIHRPCPAMLPACALGVCTNVCSGPDDADVWVNAPCALQYRCGAMAIRQNPYTGGARCMACNTEWTADELSWVDADDEAPAAAS